MRIKATFTTTCFPVNLYRHRIISLIKHVLDRTSKEVTAQWYKDKKPKPFTFSVRVIGEKEIQNASIRLDENTVVQDKVYRIHRGYVVLIISSIDATLMLDIASGLQEIDTFNFGASSYMLINDEPVILTKERIDILPSIRFAGNMFKVRTLSPIIVEDKADKPILFNDENFKEELSAIMDKKLSSLREDGKGLRAKINIVPVNAEARTVKYTINGFRKKTNKPFLYKTGSYGTFIIQAHPLDMNDIYYMGLGNRTGQGFGMLDIVEGV